MRGCKGPPPSPAVAEAVARVLGGGPSLDEPEIAMLLSATGSDLQVRRSCSGTIEGRSAVTGSGQLPVRGCQQLPLSCSPFSRCITAQPFGFFVVRSFPGVARSPSGAPAARLSERRG